MIRKTITVALLGLVLAGCEREAVAPRAGRVLASDGSVANIMSIQDTQAVDGDTITLPEGTFTWTTELKLTKNVAVIGKTVVNPDAADCPNGPNCVQKKTLIVDNKTDGNRLISFRSGGASVGPRVSGLAITKGSWTSPMQWALWEIMQGGTSPIRVDHNWVDENFATADETTGVLTQYLSRHLWIGERNFGVMDHNVMPALVGTATGYWGDHSDKGDLDWTKSAGFGGPEFFFVENNWMTHGTDINMGGKLVVRYNHMIGDTHSVNVDRVSALIVSHGIARGTPERRAGRAYEVYKNDVHWHEEYKAWDGIDGGGGIFWGNRFTNAGKRIGGISINYYRRFNNNGAPFYQADGRNAWDVNDTATNTVKIAIDQPARGKGDPIDRNNPKWPNQASEPLYEWDNTCDNPPTNIQWARNSQLTWVREGVDFFNDTPMPGYTPYTYPHPLVTGGGPGPSPSATPLPSASPTATAGNNQINQSIVDGSNISGSLEWTATVSGAAVAQVKFYIDGVDKWTEASPPYFYGGDNKKLDTTTLSNGQHTFVVKSFSSTGTVLATSTSNSTVSNGGTPAPSATATSTPTPSLTPTPTATTTPSATVAPSPTPEVIILQPGHSVLITAPSPTP